MEARDASLVSDAMGVQGKGISVAMAVAKRFVTLSPVLKRLRLLVVGDDSRSVSPGTVTVGEERLPRKADGPGPYSQFCSGTEFLQLSVSQAIQELERLRTVRSATLVSGDLQYVMMIQASLEAYLTNELERCSSQGMASGYQGIHTLQAVLLLRGLLDIYCNAMAHPPVEWQDEGCHSVAGNVAIRATEAARMLAMFSWVRSEDPLPVVWQALVAAHKLTEDEGRPRGLGDLFPSPIAASAVAMAHATIARILLLSLGDPFSLRSTEVIVADRCIANNLPERGLGKTWSNGAVAFDLMTGLPLSGRKGAAILPHGHLVWLSVNEIVAGMLERVSKHEQECQPQLRFGMFDLPRMLAKRWMAFPSHRQALRAEALVGSHLICGAQSLIQVQKPSMRAGGDKHASYVGRNCVVLDYSDTGCRIRLASANYLNLLPGVLVGIELPAVQGRSMGVISWVRRSSDSHAEVGIRIVAREIEPVPFKLLSGRWEGGSAVEFGLVAVGESGRLDRGCVEITLPRSKTPGEKLEILRAVNTGTDFHVLEVLEVGLDFLRICASTQGSAVNAEVEFAPFSI